MTQPRQAEPNFQRVAVSLQQRLAEKVAAYEGEIAILKDQQESELETLRAELTRLQVENETLSKKKD